MADTLQKQIFKEIKKRDRITYKDISEKCGVKEQTVQSRFNSDVGLAKFWEMLSACGYSINIFKTPEGQDSSIGVGEIDCTNCYYKNMFFDLKNKIDITMEYMEDNKGKEIQQDGADN